MKYYSVKEVANKLKISENTIYDRVKSGEIAKCSHGTRVIKIPATELKKLKQSRKADYFSYNPNEVQLIETYIGEIRKIIGSDEYLVMDIVKAIGLKDSYSIIRRIDNKYYRKLDIKEIKQLGLFPFHNGVLVINHKGIEIYSKKSRSKEVIHFERFLKELKDFTPTNAGATEEIPVKSDDRIQIFKSAEFGQVRTVTINNEPWFVGKDVTGVLGYSDLNKAIAMHVDDEDKKFNDKTSLSFGQRGATLINESGLYSLILSSKLPSAKQFKRWVTNEILPTIRKTGGYVDNSSKFVDNYFSNFNSDTRKLLLDELNKKNKELLSSKHKIDKQIADNQVIISKIEETLKGSD